MSIVSFMNDVPHPGEFIREELEARAWSQRDLAYILGVPEQAINLLVSGKRGVSPDMAKALAKAFDVSPEYFANLQQAYQMANARSPDPGIERRAMLQSVYPVREMIRRGWLADTDIGLLEAQMMRFFSANDLDSVPYMAHAAKKADYTETTAVQVAWLYRVRQLAMTMDVPAFSPSKFATLLEELPRYMTDPEEVGRVANLLAESGIRFVIVETLPKANIDGVCLWLDENSPVVGMTLRHDRIDNFWFVMRHELEHVAAGDGRGAIGIELIDVDIEATASDAQLSQSEARANQAATSCCVPQDQLDSFYLRKFPFISEKDVLGFAGRVRRHPGIVVGQLQRRMGRYDWLARYKIKIRHFLSGNALIDGWGDVAPVSL